MAAVPLMTLLASSTATKARNTLLVKFGIVIHHEHIGETGAGPCHSDHQHISNDHCRVRRRRCRPRGDGADVHLA